MAREGKLLVVQRPDKPLGAHMFLPCEYCFGFFNKRALYSHKTSCRMNHDSCHGRQYKESGDENQLTSFLENSHCLLSPFLDFRQHTKLLNDCLNCMKETRENSGI